MKHLDLIGSLLSGLCVIHCSITPFILGCCLHSVHNWLTWLAVPVALIALLPAYFHHRNPRVLLAGGAGMVLLLVGPLHLAPQLGCAVLERLSLAGGLIMVATHLYNRRLCRCACAH